MGISENRGPLYGTLNSRILNIRTPIRLMDKILHDPKDPKLWELWYIPYYGSCRILSIYRITGCHLHRSLLGLASA